MGWRSVKRKKSLLGPQRLDRNRVKSGEERKKQITKRESERMEKKKKV